RIKMERKRKVPPRAAARVEQNAKKRALTPSESSPTPTTTSAATPVPAAPAAQKTPSVPEPTPVEEPQLPKSLQPGKPLPTVENPQPDDLSTKDYQSMRFSGVLAESLSRSRQTWIHEGIFEKYWTKPTKRKGVTKEEPNNPPKDSMTKIGQVTITVEPHVIEATMYAVKDLKPAPTTNSTFRPIMQYGPPNGVMPPPPKPDTPSAAVQSAAASAPTTAPSPSHPQTSSQPQRQSPQSHPQPQSQLQSPAPIQPPPVQSQPQIPTQAQNSQIQPPAPAPHGIPGQPRIPQTDLYRQQITTAPSSKPLASPRGLESVLAPPQHPPAPIPPAAHAHVQPTHGPALPAATAASQPAPTPSRALQGPNQPAAGGGPALPPGAKPPPASGVKQPASAAPGADPIIVTLAERASEDPHLRDLMKRVAIGDAAPQELAHFQRIIDQITAEYKKKGGQQGPSADRLLVDGRKVKYFADEVNSILDIVLSSNPNQKSTDLRPPPDSDPLVILLVKRALDDAGVRDMVRRVAHNKTRFNDAPELKSILDRLKDRVVKEAPKPPPAGSGPSPSAASGTAEQTSVTNGAGSRKSSLASPAQQPHAASPQQALRSKGPPPAAKPDISAIVFEFAGGTGDRYLFPKYSILEYSSPNHVIASFLIVRKGSKSEYGGDPALDYYQPVTIRLHSQSGKHLENLAKVVAPPEEVRRYMDDVMDNMTRAEYVILAMRLPRADDEGQADDDRSDVPRAEQPNRPPQAGVLWNTKQTSTPAAAAPQKPTPKARGEDEQYQSFIAT
ncbi:hypothetical protein DL765_011774, partial [Monosporascus sp. GIB2]